LSKKKPLLIVAELADQQSSEQALRALEFNFKTNDQQKTNCSPDKVQPAVQEIIEEDIEVKSRIPKQSMMSQRNIEVTESVETEQAEEEM
jgi:hypothetical protein